MLENTNSSKGSFIQYKNNFWFSWRAGMCGGSVASAGNCFLINSNDFSGLNSKIQMFPSGQIQFGYEDLTVTPNTRLVIGDISSSFMTFHYAGSQVGEIFRNSVNGTTYGATSDYRLKKNVKVVKGCLKKIMSLPVVNFNFEGYGAQTGFLAHELQEIAPWCVSGYKDAVDKEGKPKYQLADYKGLVPLLTAAIQEQQIQIEKLIKKISKLETLIS